MSGTVQSGMWSTSTLEAGVTHVTADATIAHLEEEERLQRELKEMVALILMF